MNIQTEKIELAKRILDTDDEALIGKIKLLFKSNDELLWNELPEYVRQGIDESIGQANRGEFISLDEVKREISALLNK